ncbi:MAG: hypothetical protein ACFFDI_01860 [Promethearchaeota archaeon]
MDSKLNPKQRGLYLLSVDLLQGYLIILMVIGHGLLWWDHSLAIEWEKNPLFLRCFWILFMLILPLFLSLYGFNHVNSLLRKVDVNSRREIRARGIKRSVIFFLIGFSAQGLMAIVTSPNKLLNFLVTWHIFHLFGLATIVYLLIFEIAWYVEARLSGFWKHWQFSLFITIGLLLLIIAIFLFSHDYSLTQQVTISAELNITSIFHHMVFENGGNPIIPWVCFPLIGGMMAIILNLPSANKNSVLKNGGFLLLLSVFCFFIGGVFLEVERYVQPVNSYPASSSFLFFTFSYLLSVPTIAILLLDLTERNPRKAPIILYPLILLSKISLTVFFFHNVFFILDPSFIPTEELLVLVMTLYSMFFILIAFIWQRWEFKFSLEWIIWKFQRVEWRWSGLKSIMRSPS